MVLSAAALATVLAIADPGPLLLELDAMRQREHVPALGLILLDGRRPTVVKTFGAPADTAFRLGSITKTFTAIAAMRLFEDRLDQPVRRWVPEGLYANRFAATQPLRVRHLVELAGGFPDVTPGEFEQNEPLSLAAALALAPESRRTLWPPGFQHAYGNLTPGVTSALIERVAGMPFEAYVAKAVLQPTGMPTATFFEDERLPGGFQADGRTPIPYWHMSYRAFGALNATLPELAAFLSVLLNEGAGVLPRTLVAAMYAPGTTRGVTAGLGIGYGAGMYGRVRQGHVFHGHGGDADGYRSRFGLLPGLGRGYFVVINTDNPALLRALEARIEAHLTRDAKPADPPPEVSVAVDHLAGTYVPSSVRFAVEAWRRGAGRTIEVLAQDGRVEVVGRRRTVLVGVGPDVFRRPADPVATVVFFEHQGQTFMQGELGNYVRRTADCSGLLDRCIWQ